MNGLNTVYGMEENEHADKEQQQQQQQTHVVASTQSVLIVHTSNASERYYAMSHVIQNASDVVPIVTSEVNNKRPQSAFTYCQYYQMLASYRTVQTNTV